MNESLQMKEWLCFQMAGETYAHQVSKIREIMHYDLPVPVPGTSSDIKGVLNIRGEVVTIVSFPLLIGMDETTSHTQHIIVIEADTGLLGVSVDNVDRIRLFDEQHIESVTTQRAGNPIKGTINHEDQLIILVDFELYMTTMDNHE